MTNFSMYSDLLPALAIPLHSSRLLIQLIRSGVTREGTCHLGRQLTVSLLFFPEKKLTTFFAMLITVTFVDFTRVSPPAECHPDLFTCPTSFVHCSSVLCKFSHIFFIRVSPPGGCYLGRSAPFSPSDATAYSWSSFVSGARQLFLLWAHYLARTSRYACIRNTGVFVG